MMMLKNTFNLLLVFGLLNCTLVSVWGQKYTQLKNAAQGLTGLPVKLTPKQLVTQTQLFMQQHNGKLPRSCILAGNGTPSPITSLPPAQQIEVRLARQAYYQLTKNPQPKNRAWQQLHALYAKKEKKQRLPSPQAFLPVLQAWVSAHNGLRPRLNFYENSRHLTAEELRRHDQEQGTRWYEEHRLAATLAQLMRKGVADKKIREELATIEKLPTFTRWENTSDHQFYDGFGNILPAQYELLAQLENWSEAHHHTKPRISFYRQGKRLRVETLKEFPDLFAEYQLGTRLILVTNKGNQPPALRQAFLRINSLPVFHPTSQP